MLNYLRVRNLAVLRDVEAAFGPGLNVLTGETGAGKSILVEAVGLLLGERADGGLVRPGERMAVVEGQLDGLRRSDRQMLEAASLPLPDEDSLVIRREIASDGPNRVFVNDRLTSLATLKELAAGLVALHGQNRHLTLATPEAQRRDLDARCLNPVRRQALAGAWRELQQALAGEAAHATAAGEAAGQLDLLRHQLREFDALAPAEGEDEELAQEVRRLASVQERASLAGALAVALVDDDDALGARLARARQDLTRLAELDSRVAPALVRMEEAAVALAEAAELVRDALPDEDEDAGRLDAAQGRLAALQALKRRHGGSLDAAREFAQRARERIADLEDHDGTARRLRKASLAAAARFHALALEVRDARLQAAAALEQQVAGELPDLGLAGARLEVRCTGTPPPSASDPEAVRDAGGPAGYGQVEMRFTAHAGEAARPLARVASGGELSRLMLAMHLAATGAEEDGEPATAIFDEVDAGIGGAAALAVGQRLARAARQRQVICVTHLPQVAALARRQLRIEKAVVDGRPDTTVTALEGEARVEELARMLGEGMAPATARRHAEALLAGGRPAAGGTRPPREPARPRRSGPRRERWA